MPSRSAAKISSLFNVRAAFLRSVNVALDFNDPASSRDYVVTGYGTELFERIVPALRLNSSERAWRITGDYGSGKSAFALCFARIAAGEAGKLPAALRRFVPHGRRLQPVLVSGAPERLAISIRLALIDLRKRVFPSPHKSLEKLATSGGDLIELIEAHGEAVRKAHLGDGLVFILDELGQNLRHAATHSRAEDISLLQTLGEVADRSGAKPIIVLAMLHQGLSSYSSDLDTAAKREWEKVAGRYKEVVFAQPVEQVVTLVAEMLGVKENALPSSIRQESERAMSQATSAGIYGAAPAEKFLAQTAHRLYPLHPTVFPILLRLLRRFGQNERSLVGFLSSHEPHGFREYAESHAIGDDFYRLPNLYDYFKTNLAGSLISGQAAHWDVIDATVAQAQQYGDPDLAILKTIGLFNLINDPALAATENLLRAAVPGNAIAEAIRRLHTSTSIIHERGNTKGFALWPNSSVNLDAAREKAEEALANHPMSTRSIAAMLPLQSIVARRHYIETGNLRHFAVHYLDVSNFRECLAGKLPDAAGADGQIVVVVTSNAREVAEVEATLRGRKNGLGPLTLVGIATPVTRGIEIARELDRWNWIKKNLRDLAGDAYARAHVAREIKRCQNALEKELDHLVKLRPGVHGAVSWFDETGPLTDVIGERISRYLSDRCRRVFSKCPKVANELVNRRVTSSAASRARSTLIEAITDFSDRENLGFDHERNPPEFAIYLSVIKAGGLHVQHRDGWRFQSIPELEGRDPLRLAPSLKRIYEMLVAADANRCSVADLFDALRAAPYGVRDGFLPLLLAIYLAGQWDQTAVYEDGTFIEKPGADVFQRLTKEPEAFHLQHCSVRGVRREIINEVATVLNVATPKQPDVLTVVRPLMQFVGRLPEYSLQTERQLSGPTRKLRAELMKAREPATLLFESLPRALGFAPFLTEQAKATTADSRRFSDAINACVLDLRESYPRLLERTGAAILMAFHFGGTVAEFREQFTRRISAVQNALTDRELKVFALRVADSAHLEREWIESVATFVADKAPERWFDADEDEFHQRLTAFAGRFERAEAAGFNGKAVDMDKIGRAIRLTLTRPNGHEVDRVVHWTPREDAAVDRAKIELKRVLAQLGSTGIAAAAEIVWDALQLEKPKDNFHG
ncbi:hypothetical protein GALL_103430 [mine drainage metagenome]|uniref:ATP-binding protein n=1 Tax=mine drainage metagenome TaxID=410659 RepID=A0A1J5SHJ4_9ZZZZ